MNDMIMPLVTAVAVVAGIGLLIGLILSIASILMAVPKDKKAEAILEVLPGANCGACGYSGCAGYADALAKGTAEVRQCPVGGEKCANMVAVILGVDPGKTEKKVAVVRCMGSLDNTEYKAAYQGIQSCAAAARIGGGLTACTYGCIGLGDCERACPYDAIRVCNGVAVVNSDRCKACSICVKECPRGIIALAPAKEMAIVRCSNHDKGAVVRKLCKTGCIGCKKCEKACEAGAITVKDFCAFVDPAKCTGCKKCAEQCPQGCVTLFSEN